MSPPLRASNEGLLRPRVARARGTHQATHIHLLADFFSILLVVRAYEGESIVSIRAGKRGVGQLC